MSIIPEMPIMPIMPIMPEILIINFAKGASRTDRGLKIRVLGN